MKRQTLSIITRHKAIKIGLGVAAGMVAYMVFGVFDTGSMAYSSAFTQDKVASYRIPPGVVVSTNYRVETNGQPIDGYLAKTQCYDKNYSAMQRAKRALDVPNPGLEDDGKGWYIRNMGTGQGNYSNGTWSQDAHTGKTCALIENSIDRQYCILMSPSLPQFESGMNVQISFFAKWLAGDNSVFIGFQTLGDALWHDWQGSVPKDGKWHMITAKVRVPLFLANEEVLKLWIGLPYVHQSMWRKPYTEFERLKYLLDDISISALDEPEDVQQPKATVMHSFDKSDPRDDTSRFGVFWNPWKTYVRTPLRAPTEYDRTKEEIEKELDAMKQIGVKWIVSTWRWDKIEWIRGQPDYSFLDYVVDAAWNRGIRFIPSLITPPRWASTAPKDNPEYRSYPPNLDDWANFVYQTVDHFKPRIKYWETWQEPNNPRWLGTVEDFFNHHKIAYLSAKKADPRCNILFGSFSGGGRGYLEKLLRLGIKNYFDIVSFHPFCGERGVVYADQMVRGVRLILAEYGCEHRPIWLTGLGWTHEKSASRRAELLTELYTYPFHESVEKIFWFPFDTWEDTPPKDGSTGLVYVYGGNLEFTPTYDAYGKLTRKEE